MAFVPTSKDSFAALACALLIAMFAGAFAAPVSAHHGWSFYTQPLEMSATVMELHLGNPHDRLLVTDVDGRVWNLLLAPPLRNRRYGFNEETLSIGDEIEVLGERHPNRLEAKVHLIDRDGKNVYTYRYNSGVTSLQRKRRRR